MPTVEQLAAMPTMPRSVIRARANGSHDVVAWELGHDGRWYRFNDRRNPANLNLVAVLYVAEPSEQEGAA